jgi:hypothetical protein
MVLYSGFLARYWIKWIAWIALFFIYSELRRFDNTRTGNSDPGILDVRGLHAPRAGSFW